MAYTKGFIQMWFAYKDDTYYVNDNIKVNLDQYIYIRNKRDKEDCEVVYLRLTDDAVNFYSFEKKKILFSEEFIKSNVKTTKKREKQFYELQDRLKKWHTVVVMELNDLYMLYSDELFSQKMSKWIGGKNTEIKGSIAIKCPPCADVLRNYLGSDVGRKILSDLLGERASSLYSTSIEDFFSVLKKIYPDECRFLNELTAERLKTLLTTISWEKPDRFEGVDDLEKTADFLSRYFRDPCLQQKYKLFNADDTAKANSHKYKELYAILSTEKVWEKLRKAIRNAETTYGSYLEFKAALYSHRDYKSQLMICPDGFRASYSNCFMRFKVPDNEKSVENNRLIMEIYKLANMVSVKNEPHEVTNYLDDMLVKLNDWRIDKMPETFSRILKTIHLTLTYLCREIMTESEEEPYKVCVNQMNIYIRLSEQYEQYINAGRIMSDYAEALVKYDDWIPELLTSISINKLDIDTFERTQNEIAEYIQAKNERMETAQSFQKKEPEKKPASNVPDNEDNDTRFSAEILSMLSADPSIPSDTRH